MEPLITVVIPVYKVEKYLKRCVESVINQTYKNLEIILVDDGSPDSCGKICDEFAESDKRVKVIHKRNGGLSSARNMGIDISSGDYITFVDSDDWVDRDYVLYLYALLDEYECDMSMVSHSITDKYEPCLSTNDGKIKVISGNQFLMKLLKVGTQENVQYAWGKLYKNFKNTDLRFPDGLIDEDVPTTFKYTINCKNIVISERKMYFYYNNKESILRQKFTRNRFDLIEVWKIIVDFARINCNEEIYKYSLINLYRANMGVLCNLCTKEVDKDDLSYINIKRDEALEVVKKHKWELLRFKMPISRKLMVILFNINFKMVYIFSRFIKIRCNF